MGKEGKLSGNCELRKQQGRKGRVGTWDDDPSGSFGCNKPAAFPRSTSPSPSTTITTKGPEKFCRSE